MYNATKNMIEENAYALVRYYNEDTIQSIIERMHKEVQNIFFHSFDENVKKIQGLENEIDSYIEELDDIARICGKADELTEEEATAEEVEDFLNIAEEALEKSHLLIKVNEQLYQIEKSIVAYYEAIEELDYLAEEGRA